MSRINRVPLGLQDLLGSQNLGQNPSDLSQVVAPTHDMFPHWAMERLVQHRTTGSEVTAAGAQAGQNITIPEGEAWIMVFASSSLAGFETVGQRIQWSHSMTRLPQATITTGGTHLAQTPVITAVQSGEDPRLNFQWSQRVQYPSGTIFQIIVDMYDPAASPNVFISQTLQYWRLET